MRPDAAGERGAPLARRRPSVLHAGVSQTTALPLAVGMIVFDGMTNMDFVGPHEVFARMPGATVHVLARTPEAVVTDLGLRVLPGGTLRDAPPLDLLFVGGGPGTTALMEDAEVVGFLRDRAPAARWITSVCTGALVLGAAGLLRGHRAATHWAAMEALVPFGAEPTHRRVVVDRNRVTGGGVTAGLDFGLVLADLLHGAEVAQGLQLGMEYDPEPPFSAGSPATAPAALVARLRGAMAPMNERRVEVARRVAAAPGWPDKP